MWSRVADIGIGYSPTDEAGKVRMKLLTFSSSPIAMDRALFTIASTVAEAVKPSFLENRIAEGRIREHFAIIDLRRPSSSSFLRPSRNTGHDDSMRSEIS